MTKEIENNKTVEPDNEKQTTLINDTNKRIKHVSPDFKIESPWVKRVAFIILLIIVLLFPFQLVFKFIGEREGVYKREALKDITSNWGTTQTIIGPVLVIPYQSKIKQVREVNRDSAQMLAEISKIEELFLTLTADKPNELNIKIRSTNFKNRYDGVLSKNERIFIEGFEVYSSSEAIEQSLEKINSLKSILSKPFIVEDIILKDFYAVFLPKKLAVDSKLIPHERKRGVYKVMVYEGDFDFNGTFAISNLNEKLKGADNIFWDKAQVLLNLNEIKSVLNVEPLKINNITADFYSSKVINDIKLPSGLVADVDLLKALGESKIEDNSVNREVNFSFKLNLAGSYSFEFKPLAEQNTLLMASSWTEPSFFDNSPKFRLTEKQKISEIDPEFKNLIVNKLTEKEVKTDLTEGFYAYWTQSDAVKNYPSPLICDKNSITTLFSFFNEYNIGVKLLADKMSYTQVLRAVKYAPLFICLTFLAFFLFELSLKINNQKLHILQYGLIGLALIMFYLSLLAFSEYLSFTLSYIIASAIIIAMIVIYTHATLKRLRETNTILFGLIALFTTMFFILRSKDYALLIGTVFLLVILALTMFATRNLNRKTIEDKTTTV